MGKLIKIDDLNSVMLLYTVYSMFYFTKQDVLDLISCFTKASKTVA